MGLVASEFAGQAEEGGERARPTRPDMTPAARRARVRVLWVCAEQHAGRQTPVIHAECAGSESWLTALADGAG